MIYYQVWKGNKYKNQKQEYNGRRYDSKFESQKAYELDMLVRAKEIKSWTPQVKVEINFKKNRQDEWVLTDEPIMELKKKGIKYYHLFNYFVDFVIENTDGTKEYCELKGMMLEPGLTKIKLLSLILENDPSRYSKLERQSSHFKFKH